MENNFGGENEGLGASKELARKPRFFRTVVGAFLALFVFVGGFAFYRAYKDWTAQEKIEKLAEALRNWEKENYERQLADTYGGKTPQETLRMYIDAVEKGDYELASKYFILEKREEWEKELVDIKNSGKISNFLTPIKEGLKSVGEYSLDKKEYFFNKPVSIDFVLYPNGIWKIVEI